ncbi:hypothetical protein KP79_PYT09127 [Mizuhopecten yessoensis]|uniref:Jacalin-type lectin domain-containing protein n=2 Tax=Mizuhopecten yessoensis TaxID=6573 RepID=A0A210PNQ4_MIZYE|nr:hypothetical protein KP79_PYT09127 [Mizuhopecten yessoensis]
MPSFWDNVPQGKWNIVMDKPTTHPTEAYVSKVSEFNDKLFTEPDVVVTSIELYFRPWLYTDVKTTDVLGGMKLSYDNGYEICHGIKPKSNSTKNEQLIKAYKIRLTRGELIHTIDVAFGWCINRLTFYTSKGRQLGPFGGKGGDVHKYKSPANGQFGHFHCFSGREIMTYEMLALTHLQIGWAHFETSDANEDQMAGSENNITTDQARSNV